MPPKRAGMNGVGRATNPGQHWLLSASGVHMKDPLNAPYDGNRQVLQIVRERHRKSLPVSWKEAEKRFDWHSPPKKRDFQAVVGSIASRLLLSWMEMVICMEVAWQSTG